MTIHTTTDRVTMTCDCDGCVEFLALEIAGDPDATRADLATISPLYGWRIDPTAPLGDRCPIHEPEVNP